MVTYDKQRGHFHNRLESMYMLARHNVDMF
jgi:hypothetical protein